MHVSTYRRPGLGGVYGWAWNVSNNDRDEDDLGGHRIIEVGDTTWVSRDAARSAGHRRLTQLIQVQY